MTTRSPTRTASFPSTDPAVRTGLGVAMLLAVTDVVVGITTISGDAVGNAVAVLVGVLAAATLVSLPAAWRGSARALRAVAVTRLIAAFTAVPAFFVDDVAPELVIAAAVTVVAALVVAVLVIPRRVRS